MFRRKTILAMLVATGAGFLNPLPSAAQRKTSSVDPLSADSPLVLFKIPLNEASSARFVAWPQETDSSYGAIFYDAETQRRLVLRETKKNDVSTLSIATSRGDRYDAPFECTGEMPSDEMKNALENLIAETAKIGVTKMMDRFSHPKKNDSDLRSQLYGAYGEETEISERLTRHERAELYSMMRHDFPGARLTETHDDDAAEFDAIQKISGKTMKVTYVFVKDGDLVAKCGETVTISDETGASSSVAITYGENGRFLEADYSLSGDNVAADHVERQLTDDLRKNIESIHGAVRSGSVATIGWLIRSRIPESERPVPVAAFK